MVQLQQLRDRHVLAHAHTAKVLHLGLLRGTLEVLDHSLRAPQCKLRRILEKSDQQGKLQAEWVERLEDQPDSVCQLAPCLLQLISELRCSVVTPGAWSTLSCYKYAREALQKD